MPPPCPPDALVVESVRFPAGAYRLEGELLYAEGSSPAGLAVIAGPHPLLGGHMGNNVVVGLGDRLARHGRATLRFNYRGVGGSEGPAPDVAVNLARFWQTSRVPDEQEHHADLRAAVTFLRHAVDDDLPVALVGYSYGCTLLAGAVVDASTPLVLVAPTVGTHDYDTFAEVSNPKLVIAPEGDFAADAGRLRDWFDRLPGPRRLLRPHLDSHFFRGHEGWLAETVAAFLDDPGRG